MTQQENMEYWKSLDTEMKSELESITDETELEDRFCQELQFGTGGLRGRMGAGPGRMNLYTVRRATWGLARYLLGNGAQNCRVAIAYDSRHNSRRFAEAAACVLTRQGIAVYLFDTLTPTPVLSFAVRHHACSAGIVLTASHNPKEYNGYKVYDETGCQLTPDAARAVEEQIALAPDYGAVEADTLEEAQAGGLLRWIGADTLEAFLDAVRQQRYYTPAQGLRVVYTPLHGTGNVPVRRILEPYQPIIVEQQEAPDGAFPTVKSPNPEERETLNLALECARREQADLVLGTDPDCDRVGVGVRHGGGYQLLTGNQIGALLARFLIVHSSRPLDERDTVVKTIVTNELGANIAKKAGLSVAETLTGFKYIGDQMNRYAMDGNRRFFFGYEESYGFLAGTYARDKDAVVASYLICQMAAWYKAQDMTLVDGLEALYREYGYYLDHLDAFTLEGLDGVQRIQAIMKRLRESGSSLFSGVSEVQDYQVGLNGLPRENVLKFVFSDGSWLAARPSGTEPKIKFYYSIVASDRTCSAETLQRLQAVVRQVVNG
ncbi:MAG: phospho-sugar mutase [Clostridiales bacterium]|nr:phospho-sugar mutase [Clostridiales bacterium]